ncbi:MAG: phytanoyl-CoA dioxygenase family protein [Candidatus Hydrogenedentes bacterium]|nr:phytanoyl-CoA dioxygenase family protein [Candidatus Hydrogenedentota bacterium]
MTTIDTSYALTEAQVRQYHEDGFLVFENLIRGGKLRRYVALFDELVEQSKTREQDGAWTFERDATGALDPRRILHKIQGVCVVEPRVLELAKEPEIIGPISSLIGSNLDIFGTKFFPMIPGGGTSTMWHQDNYYFSSESEQIVTCGIYLQDTDRENGCLKVIPRSHTRGRFTHNPNPATYGSWVDVDESEAVNLVIPGGTVILFSANLLHGANPNVSNRTRYSTAWHYLPGDMVLPPFNRGEYPDRHIVLGA